MSDEIMETEAETETAAVETQESKTFTQDELDRIVADRVAREQRKFDKRLSGVDLDEAKDLLCRPMKIDWTFYCHECDGMASLRTCPHDKESRVILSGTKLRKALSDGAEIVDHFGRNEVLDHLKIYYGGLKEKVEVKMQGAASGDSM